MQSSSSATFNCSLQNISYNYSVMTKLSMQQMGAAGSNYYGHELDICSNNPLINIEQHNSCGLEAPGDTNSCKQDSSHSYSNTKTNTSTFLSVCHDSSINLHPKTTFKTSLNPNPDSDCMDYPDCESLTEGQGESNGDHMSSACNGSAPTLCDNSEPDIINMQGGWRRLSPTAASSFCKDIEEEQEYFQQLLGSSSHGWTDEKHSSYLDSMEADFLRNVMFKSGVHAEPSELDDSASSHQAKAPCTKAAKEFKVCQNGRWRPMSVEASYVNISPLKQIAVAVKNPWIKRFKASKRVHFPSLIMEGSLLRDGNTHLSIQQKE